MLFHTASAKAAHNLDDLRERWEAGLISPDDPVLVAERHNWAVIRVMQQYRCGRADAEAILARQKERATRK